MTSVGSGTNFGTCAWNSSRATVRWLMPAQVSIAPNRMRTMVRGRVERTAGVRVAIGVVPFTVVVGFGGLGAEVSGCGARGDGVRPRS